MNISSQKGSKPPLPPSSSRTSKRRVIENTAQLAFVPAWEQQESGGAPNVQSQPVYHSLAPLTHAVDHEPVLLHALTTSHPDSVLRRLGVVRQGGVLKSHVVYFNPKTTLWHRVDNDQLPSHEVPNLTKISGRFDEVPGGVIQIVGDDRGLLAPLDELRGGTMRTSRRGTTDGAASSREPSPHAGESTMPSKGGLSSSGRSPRDDTHTPLYSSGTGGAGGTALRMSGGANAAGSTAHPFLVVSADDGYYGSLNDDAHNDNLNRMASYHKAALEAAGGSGSASTAAGNSHSGPTGSGTGNVAKNVLHPEHQRNVLRQYLARALPAAAVRTNAVIVLPDGSSAFAQHVGVGASSLQKSRTQLSATTNVVNVVAVTPFRETIPALHPGVTHHVILRRSLMSRFPSSAVPVDVCRGWLTDALVSDRSDASDGGADHPVAPLSGGGVLPPMDPDVELSSNATCIFCKGSKEWHIPADVLRRYHRDRTIAKWRHELRTVGGSGSSAAGKSARLDVNPLTPMTPQAVGGNSFEDSADPPLHAAATTTTCDTATEVPTAAELDGFVSRVVDQLAVGVRPELLIPGRKEAVQISFPSSLTTKAPPQTPERAGVPVVVILFGGDHHAMRRYLTQCLTRRYTILVVVGSGGYADYLWHIRSRIDAAFPRGGRDGVRRYSTALDPLTSEILCNFDLVKFIRRGAKNEELIRQIEGGLRGDSALLNAWSTYAVYERNATVQKWLYGSINILLMLLGLLVTFLTVLQTFLLLRMVRRGESIPPTIPASADSRGEGFLWGWTIMQWSIIGLPIVISAIQATLVRADFGGKWIALRTASQRLLSEIYQYRTSCLLYKEDEIEKHSSGAAAVDGELDAEADLNLNNNADGSVAQTSAAPLGSGAATSTKGLVYCSKEDLLQQRAHQLSEQLLRGPCRQLKLIPTDSTTIPPRHILKVDDGFSTLTPDQYLRVRLRTWTERFEEDAGIITKIAQVCQNSIVVTSGIGTGLAAVAAYTDSTIQAWLAFTTAVVATLLRALEGFRLEFQSKKQVEAARNLRVVEAWWGSLQERADTTDNRDSLVEQVETIIMDELDSWAQQFGHAVQVMKSQDAKGKGDGGDGGGGPDDDGEIGAGKRKADGGEEGDDAARATIRELGLEELSPSTILRTLTDDAVPSAQKEEAKRKIQELRKRLTVGTERGRPKSASVIKQSKILATIEEARMDEERRLAERVERGETVFVMSRLKFVPLREAGSLPEIIENILNTRSLRFDKLMIPAIQHFNEDIRQGDMDDDDGDGESGRVEMAMNRAATSTNTASTPRHTAGGGAPNLNLRFDPQSLNRSGSVDATSSPISHRVMFARLANARSFSFHECVLVIASIPEFQEHVNALSGRHILEICKRIICENLIEVFSEKLPEIKRSLRLCRPATTAEDLVSQLTSIALTPSIECFGINGILMLIRDPMLRMNLSRLSEAFFYKFVAVCLDVFHRGTLLYVLYERMCVMIAELDVDEMVADVENGVALARSVERFLRFGIRPWVMQRDDLLRVFPERTRLEIENRSFLQLAMYVDQVMASKPSLTSVTLLLRRYGSSLFHPSLFQFLQRALHHQVLFATLAESLLQSDILRLPRPALIRLMDFSKCRELESLIGRMPTKKLRLALSTLQTIHSNSYGASLVDQVCDKVVDFSLRNTLNYENVVRLVMKLPELRVRIRNSYAGDKAMLLRLFGFPKLIEALDKLSEEQLTKLFYAFQETCATDWTILQSATVLKDALDESTSSAQAPRRRSTRQVQVAAEENEPDGGQEPVAMPKRPEANPTEELLSWTSQTLRRIMWASAATSVRTLARKRKNAAGNQSESGNTTARTRNAELTATLLDAPDAVVRQALQAFNPEDAREILRRLQPLGVEADISTIFGRSMSQGGYESDHVTVMEDALQSWETRQAIVEGLGMMLVDRKQLWFELSPADFVDALHKAASVDVVWALPDCDHDPIAGECTANAEVHTAPQCLIPTAGGGRNSQGSLLEDGVVRRPSGIRELVLRLQPSVAVPYEVLYDYYFNVLTELRFSSPLLVFYRLAAVCRFLDIRELFSTVEERVDLVSLLTIAILDAESGIFWRPNSEGLNDSDSDSDSEEGASDTGMERGRTMAPSSRQDSEQTAILVHADEETEGDTSVMSSQTRPESLLRVVSPTRGWVPSPAEDSPRAAALQSQTNQRHPHRAPSPRASVKKRWAMGATSKPDESTSKVDSAKPAQHRPLLFRFRVHADYDSTDCALMGLMGSTSDAHQQALPAGRWRWRVLQVLSRYYESTASPSSSTHHKDKDAPSPGDNNLYQYGATIAALHRLEEPYLRYLFECQAKVLQSTIGRFFVRLIRYKRPGLDIPRSHARRQQRPVSDGIERAEFRPMRRLSLRESFAFDVAIQNLVRNAKIFPIDLQTSLDKLDPAAFAKRPHSERREALRQWISAGGDEVVDLLVSITASVDLLDSGRAKKKSKSRQRQRSPSSSSQPDMFMPPPRLHHMTTGGSGTDEQTDTSVLRSDDPTVVEDGSHKCRLFRLLFHTIRIALPDDDQNPLEANSYLCESRLTELMTKRATVRATALAAIAVSKMKEGRRQSMHLNAAALPFAASEAEEELEELAEERDEESSGRGTPLPMSSGGGGGGDPMYGTISTSEFRAFADGAPDAAVDDATAADDAVNVD